MSSLTELASIIESAKLNDKAPITITGGDLLAMLQFARVLGEPAPTAFASIDNSLREISERLPDVDDVAEDEIVTITDICGRLKISRTTLYEWRRKGTFDIQPVNAAGTKWLRRDFIQWLRERKS